MHPATSCCIVLRRAAQRCIMLYRTASCRVMRHHVVLCCIVQHWALFAYTLHFKQHIQHTSICWYELLIIAINILSNTIIDTI